MDLNCQKCGESWSLFHVTDDLSKEDRFRFLKGDGCERCGWGARLPEKPPFRAELMRAMRDIMGDDLDGIAAELEDAKYLSFDVEEEEGGDDRFKEFEDKYQKKLFPEK